MWPAVARGDAIGPLVLSMWPAVARVDVTGTLARCRWPGVARVDTRALPEMDRCTSRRPRRQMACGPSPRGTSDAWPSPVRRHVTGVERVVRRWRRPLANDTLLRSRRRRRHPTADAGCIRPTAKRSAATCRSSAPVSLSASDASAGGLARFRGAVRVVGRDRREPPRPGPSRARPPSTRWSASPVPAAGARPHWPARHDRPRVLTASRSWPAFPGGPPTPRAHRS
jgi:hypothetical protein